MPQYGVFAILVMRLPNLPVAEAFRLPRSGDFGHCGSIPPATERRFRALREFSAFRSKKPLLFAGEGLRVFPVYFTAIKCYYILYNAKNRDSAARQFCAFIKNHKRGMQRMKQLMLGNKAFARGLYEAGCQFVSSYPGTPSTEVTEEAALYDEIYCEWAPNEKVAMEAAFGASLAGKRSFCGMKHVGLNVAADPLFTMSYTGVNAGLVICVADDAGMHSSQNEQDSRHHAIAAKLPMLEPSDSAETLAFVKKAYEISEEFDTPVIVKM